MLPPKILEQYTALSSYLASIGVSSHPATNEELLCSAFVHRSYAADYTGAFIYNERLEFLGDAILSAIVAKLLYKQFPDRAESDLTLYKIALVRAETLAEVAIDIGLDKKIFLGNGEEKNNGRQKITILCDCFEAMLGYLYLDYGADEVEMVVQKYIMKKLDGHTHLSVRSYKTLLQEHTQKLQKLTPYYEEKELGKDPVSHEMIYESSVYIETTLLGTGTGTNKKKAQENAAQSGYESLVGSSEVHI
jgi:ribonuclease III